MTTKTIKLTAQETTALNHAYRSAASNGHDFGFVEDVVKAMKRTHKAQAVGALITSLEKKGVITVHGAITTDSGRWTQFTWRCTVEQLDRLI